MDWEHNDNYLIHYGVKGQKWGERRYRNEDGSLTAEGREHYGIGKMSDTKRYFGGDNLRRGIARWRNKRHGINLEKAKTEGNEKKIAKYKSKQEAQSKANADMEKYLKDKSTPRLVAQNALAKYTGTTGALHAYRQSRARGASGIRAFAETVLPVTGTILRLKGNKKKYGKHIVWSGLEEKVNNIL